MASDLVDRLINAWEPVHLLYLSLYFLFITLVTQPPLLKTPSRLRQEWFRAFFTHIGPESAKNQFHRAALKTHLSSFHGVVLDIGPGLGHQLHLFVPIISQVTHIYAIEPTLALHKELKAKAADLGFAEKYTVLPAGAEPQQLIPALQKVGLDVRKGGCVDGVLAIKSMCSVPKADVQASLDGFQGLLRRGGEFVFLEHVGNKKDIVTMVWARILNLVWPALLGGCRLDGEVEVLVEKMKGWQAVDVQLTETSRRGWEVLPFVIGKAVKA